ncbi:PAP2 superfamily protein [Motilibacter peucedani]|uniref:PAP2 superfamily protein n=1 Tax=Motilibacter peucedani TaxID=598650 RepID=A0A420XQV5_9ACTN|nr:phosphatase PAP2 family protein [Motilibacter peucedani]RKS75627.1 PAP2 superfamily protein [Motilibacter peucedani]
MQISSRRPVLVALLVALAACSALLVAVAFEVFVRTQTGQLVEIAAMGGVTIGQGSLAPHASRVLDVVSVSMLAAALLVTMAIGLARGRWRSALSAALLIGGSSLTTELLKKHVLTRPNYGNGVSNSFPSGHTTVAASVAAAAVLVAPRRLRPYVAVLGCGYAIATGLATVVAGWHRPSDVIAAYAVVLAWASVTAALVVDAAPPDASSPAPDTPHRTTALFLASSAAPLGVLAVGLIAMTARHVPGSFGQLRQVAAYAGGMAAIATAGLVTMAVWLLVVPFVDAAGRHSSTGAEPALTLQR